MLAIAGFCKLKRFLLLHGKLPAGRCMPVAWQPVRESLWYQIDPYFNVNSPDISKVFSKRRLRVRVLVCDWGCQAESLSPLLFLSGRREASWTALSTALALRRKGRQQGSFE